ncbi:MAG: hypothetical protein IJE07_13105 [Clostridia bacterium]|nr:hypothetical protein [Clostridia bacterium]
MWWMIPALVAAAAVLYVLRRIAANRNEQERMLMERVRTTALYRAFYPTLQRCERCCVEQILIRREEITIRMFRPMNEVVRFNFAARALEPVDNPAALQALARAMAMDSPMLDDPDKFWFVRKRSARDVGQPDVWYEYNVQPAYRDTMLRAWYDRPEPEDGIVS